MDAVELEAVAEFIGMRSCEGRVRGSRPGATHIAHEAPRANGKVVGHAVVAMRGVASMTYYSTLRRSHRLGRPPARTAVRAWVEHGQNVALKRRFLMVRAVGMLGRGI